MTGRTITGTALEAGIDPTNMSRFLKGHQTVSDLKIKKVLEILGIDNTKSLSVERIHIWTIKSGTLFPISRLLSCDGQDYEMVYLNPIDRKLKDYFGFMKSPLLIRSCSTTPVKIVFRRRPPVLLPETEFQKEDVVLVQSGLARWRKIPKKYLYPTIDVENSVYERFYSDKDVSVQDFEKVWNSVYEIPSSDGNSILADPGTESEYGWTWESVVSKAKKSGLTPGDVAEKLGLEKKGES